MYEVEGSACGVPIKLRMSLRLFAGGFALNFLGPEFAVERYVIRNKALGASRLHDL